MHRAKKTWIIVILVLLTIAIVIGLLGYLVFGTRRKAHHDIDAWNAWLLYKDFLPSTEDMGEYEDLYFKNLQTSSFIFVSEANILKASYSPEEYEIHKTTFLDIYSFQDSVIDRGRQPVEKDATFDFDGFTFRMLSLDAYGLEYPKEMVFVGVSDEKCEIAFVYFIDTDLDYIDCSFQEFLVDECGWD